MGVEEKRTSMKGTFADMFSRVKGIRFGFLFWRNFELVALGFWGERA